MKRFTAMAKIGAIFLFVAMLSAGVAFSQQVTGTISGRVTDSTGGVVPEATIQIQNPATGFSRTDQADADGRYLESNLPSGSYTITVQKAGFQTLVRSGVDVTVGAQVTINAELVVGDVQQHVEVTGEAPAIETSNATISGLVSQDQLRDLPLNGRSIDSLALLSPVSLQTARPPRTLRSVLVFTLLLTARDRTGTSTCSTARPQMTYKAAAAAPPASNWASKASWNFVF